MYFLIKSVKRKYELTFSVQRMSRHVSNKVQTIVLSKSICYVMAWIKFTGLGKVYMSNKHSTLMFQVLGILNYLKMEY